MKNLSIIANFVLFECVWFATVVGAASGLTWPGLAALATFMVVHAIAEKQLGRSSRKDWIICAICLARGLIVEGFYSGSGLLVHPASPGSIWPPVWILVLWANLGLILNHSVAWLQNRLTMAAALGAVGGAISYIAGVALGAAEFGWNETVAITVIGVTWATVTPVLLLAARALNGNSSATRVA